MRIVLDTNVIIAAFAARGLCDKDLLVLINHAQVKIMTPRAFWEFLRQPKP